MHARKDEEYTNYEEVRNASTTKLRHSKRMYEQKLACNIKYDSKILYAYVRRKQNVRPH